MLLIEASITSDSYVPTVMLNFRHISQRISMDVNGDVSTNKINDMRVWWNGRHGRFRFCCREAWGFKSLYAHYPTISIGGYYEKDIYHNTTTFHHSIHIGIGYSKRFAAVAERSN